MTSLTESIPAAEYANWARIGRPVPSPMNNFTPYPYSPVEVGRDMNSLEIIPWEIEEAKRTQLASFKEILGTVWPRLAWKDRSYLLLGFFSAFIVAASTPAFAYVLARLLGIYYLQGDRASQAIPLALSLLVISCVDGTATFCMHYTLECTGQSWVNSLRTEALRRILAQPRSWFDKGEFSTSRLNECLDRDAEETRNLVGRFAGPVFTIVWMLGISIIWAFLISWKLSLVAVACILVVWATTSLFSHISSKWEDRCNLMSAETSDIFTETFSNIRVVRALNLESYFEKRHGLSSARTYKTGLCRGIFSGIVFGLGDAISFLITATVFYYGTVIITSGSLSVAAVLEVVNLLLFGIGNSMAILALIPQLSSSLTTATLMLKLVNLPLQFNASLGFQRLATPLPVKFNNLNFTYPTNPHQRALSSITLTIKPGTCTAIVGSSGSGKSTLTSLILGLYPPDPVSLHHPAPLTFSGIPISECNISSLRSHMAIVPQSPILFPTTVLENIIYGLPEFSPLATPKAAELAARDAGIHDFISSLPKGYQTTIGDGGQDLSGGQAQRVAIARALVRRPKLLILDEATSALDAVSAEMVRETINKLIERGRQSGEDSIAVLIIGHAVEMMRICEKIVVLEAGHIAEVGKFEELKGEGGVFARLIGGTKDSQS